MLLIIKKKWWETRRIDLLLLQLQLPTRFIRPERTPTETVFCRHNHSHAADQTEQNKICLLSILIQKVLNTFFFQRAYQKLGIFEGRVYLIYDFFKDPFDGGILAYIPALVNDVAACEINLTGYYQPLAVPDPAVRSLMGAVTGPEEVIP